MKKFLTSLICLISLQAHALIVSVNGHGDIPETGMEITIDKMTRDLLTGEYVMEMKGTLLCNDALNVTITREIAGLNDEFCCADECTGGNGEQTEELEFHPSGISNWFVHYFPTPGSYVTVTYTFTGDGTSRQLTVHFDATSTEGVESVQDSGIRIQKVLENGILYIIKDNKKYTIL